MLEVFNYSVALLDGETMFYSAPFPLELLGKGIWLYDPKVSFALETTCKYFEVSCLPLDVKIQSLQKCRGNLAHSFNDEH